MNNNIDYIPNLKKITNPRQQNYFAEQGLFTLYQKGKAAYYEKTKKLEELMDRYYIRSIFKARY